MSIEMKPLETSFKVSIFTLLFAGLYLNPVKAQSTDIEIMSLNVYGWKTMPQHSEEYAKLVVEHNINVLAIQEGVEDWQLTTDMPTDYSRAEALLSALGPCWQRSQQIYVNHCVGIRFIDSGRFDLTDGPNATRTGEFALVEHNSRRFIVINVHFDHEQQQTRILNTKETLAQLASYNSYPQIVLGDFNQDCDAMFSLMSSLIPSEIPLSAIPASEILLMERSLKLLTNAGIDCIFINNFNSELKSKFSSQGKVVEALPSDHPAAIASLKWSK
jgi:endonuclease/exonuclease/phosphatase family metal-dependent hydrolase